MAFGIKIEKIEFKNEYTIPELYEVIKDVTFSAGTAQLVTYMGSKVIVFPALDSTNQVQIMSRTMKKPGKKYVVQKGDELSLEGAAKNLILSSVTKGYSNIARLGGSNKKECIRLIDETVKELTALNL
ncbi:MAG: hypothetical protein R3Y35_09660 [Clostridia bacterium]